MFTISLESTVLYTKQSTLDLHVLAKNMPVRTEPKESH